MAITIDISSGDLEQGSDMNKPAQHTTFISDLMGKGFSSKTITDEDDPDTWTSVYFYNPSVTMEDIASWDELGEYANENEVYINVYDHDSKERKGYWFDEDQEWIDMDTDSGEEYEANAPK
jgi:hypothetical protein